jgi:hypothetical protein
MRRRDRRAGRLDDFDILPLFKASSVLSRLDTGVQVLITCSELRPRQLSRIEEFIEIPLLRDGFKSGRRIEIHRVLPIPPRRHKHCSNIQNMTHLIVLA